MMVKIRIKAFTLVELLVVISVISLLLAIMVPSLAASKSLAQTLVCKSNIRQIVIATLSYTSQNNDYFVPAASDMFYGAGLNRWHGRRESINELFNSDKGPLAAYLSDGKVKECPANVSFNKGMDWNTNFEQGCGGYGYNLTYIGSRIWQYGITEYAYKTTTRTTEIAQSDKTLIFADTAMSNKDEVYIEYSFAEPPFSVYKGEPITSFYMSPSIHFRHRNNANIGWADGHIASLPIALNNTGNIYGINSAKMKLGWFNPIDNTLFDLE